MKNLNFYILYLVTILLIPSCQDQTITPDTKPPLPPEIQELEIPHFVTRDSLVNPKKLQLVKAYQNLSFSQPENPALTGSWAFGLGDPKRGLKVAINARPRLDSVVSQLPHLINKPNWPIWYSRKIKIEAPSILEVNADDGAQVFQDGQLLNPVNGNFFPLQSKADSSRIDIRVLNNALSGGLRRVALISENDFGNQQLLSILKIFAQKLVRQSTEEPVLRDNVYNEVLRSLQQLNRENQRTADRYFAPILIEPFLQKSGFSEFALLYERSTRTSTKLDWMDTQQRLPNRFLCESRNELVCEVRTDLLEAGIPYDITISDNRTKANFRVQAPPNQIAYSFSAWGDSQGGWNTFRTLVDQMSEKQDAFTIGLGDLVADGSKKDQWIDFFSCLSPISKTTPLFMVAGNHDYDGFYNNLIPLSILSYIRNNNNDLTYYSWRAPYAAFIVLDPNRNFPIGIDQRQGEWLQKELASDQWQSAQWRFILIHQPPYSQGWEGYHGDSFIKNLMDQMAESAKIDFVLSGHSHNYERLTKKYGNQETTFLVLGGAGGTLEGAASSDFPKMDKVIKQHHFGRFFLENKKLRFEVRNLEGEVIDEFEKNK